MSWKVVVIGGILSPFTWNTKAEAMAEVMSIKRKCPGIEPTLRPGGWPVGIFYYQGRMSHE